MYQHFIDKFPCHIVLNSIGPHLRYLELQNTDIIFCNLTIHKMLFKENYDNLQRDFSKLASKHAAEQNIQ